MAMDIIYTDEANSLIVEKARVNGKDGAIHVFTLDEDDFEDLDLYFEDTDALVIFIDDLITKAKNAGFTLNFEKPEI